MTDECAIETAKQARKETAKEILQWVNSKMTEG